MLLVTSGFAGHLLDRMGATEEGRSLITRGVLLLRRVIESVMRINRQVAGCLLDQLTQLLMIRGVRETSP